MTSDEKHHTQLRRFFFASDHPEWQSFEFQADVHCTISCMSAWRSSSILGVTAVWSAPTYSSLKDERPAVSGNILAEDAHISCLFSQMHLPLPFPVSPYTYASIIQSRCRSQQAVNRERDAGLQWLWRCGLSLWSSALLMWRRAIHTWGPNTPQDCCVSHRWTLRRGNHQNCVHNF